MGMGFGKGPDRARQAADMAISSPLLEDISICGAQGLLVNFMGGEDMTLTEVDEASTLILEAAGADANVIFGAVIDPSMREEIRVTLIATGFGNGKRASRPREIAKDAQRGAALEMCAEPALEGANEGPGETPVPETPETCAPERPQAPVPVYAQAEREPMVAIAGAGRAGSAVRSGWSASPSGRAVDLADGVLGPARPIRGRPAASMEARPVEVPMAGAAIMSEEENAAALTCVEQPGPEPDGEAANVVPLVWKKNLQGQRWAPKMSSRWQRVLRRDQMDVPSFLRRRQMD